MTRGHYQIIQLFTDIIQAVNRRDVSLLLILVSSEEQTCLRPDPAPVIHRVSQSSSASSAKLSSTSSSSHIKCKVRVNVVTPPVSSPQWPVVIPSGYHLCSLDMLQSVISSGTVCKVYKKGTLYMTELAYLRAGLASHLSLNSITASQNMHSRHHLLYMHQEAQEIGSMKSIGILCTLL